MTDTTPAGTTDDERATDPHATPVREYGVMFWAGTLAGWVISAVGLKLLVDDPEAAWFNTLRLTAIGLVAHDAVWLAASAGGGWLLTRLLGRDIPGWLAWAGWTSAIVVALWFPLWRGYGDRLRNPTILPRDYGDSIVVLLAVIWLGAGTAALVARRRESGAGSQRSDG